MSAAAIIWWSAMMLASFDADRCKPCPEPQKSETLLVYNGNCGKRGMKACPLQIEGRCFEFGFRDDGVVLWKELPVDGIDVCAELEKERAK